VRRDVRLREPSRGVADRVMLLALEQVGHLLMDRPVIAEDRPPLAERREAIRDRVRVGARTRHRCCHDQDGAPGPHGVSLGAPRSTCHDEYDGPKAAM
jgi:hypothetical protein